jgi:hypothetical protein
VVVAAAGEIADQGGHGAVRGHAEDAAAVELAALGDIEGATVIKHPGPQTVAAAAGHGGQAPVILEA